MSQNNSNYSTNAASKGKLDKNKESSDVSSVDNERLLPQPTREELEKMTSMRNKITRYILNEAKGSKEFKQLSVKIFGLGDYHYYTLKKMCEAIDKGTFQRTHANVYANETQHIAPSGARADPTDKIESKTGIPVEYVKTLPPFTGVHTFEAVIDGSPITCKGVFHGNGKKLNRENAGHEHDNRLKHTMRAWISHKKNDFYAVPLCMQDAYGHQGKGPLVLTGAFITNTIMTHLPRIMDCKYTVLTVSSLYAHGFYFSDEVCYFSAPDGMTWGVSAGSDHIWKDRSDPFPAYGNYGEYSIRTLATYGPQRILLMTPGRLEGTDEPLALPTPSAWKARLKGKVMLKTKAALIGLYDRVVDPETYGNLYLTESRLLSAGIPMNRYQKLITYLMSPKRWLTAALPPAISIVLWLLGRRFGQRLQAAGLTTLMLWIISRYIARKYGEFTISLGIIPLQFYGKFKDDLNDFYMQNPIDSRGLPYGYYRRTPFSLQQVAQHGDRPNYTNVPELIARYIKSRGFSDVTAPSVYNDELRASQPLITKPDDQCFKEQTPTALPRLSSCAPYRIQLPEKNALAVRLLSPERYRQFVVGEISARSMCATAGNRMLSGGLISQVSEEEFLEMLLDFWKAYDGGVCPPLDPEPHLDKFKGRKRRMYEKIRMKIGATLWRAYYISFPKIEALPLATFLKKAVRLIVMNSKFFNVVWKNFFEWFEHTLLTFHDQYGNIFTKGMNVHQIWLLYNALAEVFQFYVPIDFKKFDSTHKLQNYTAEQKFWGKLGLPREIVQELIDTPVRGVISHNVPMRHSGDLFTGSGNCLIVASLLHHFSNRIRITCNGDDTGIWCNDLTVIKDIREFVNIRGYDITYEDAVPLFRYVGNRKELYEFELEHCHMVYTRDGYFWDVERMLNRMANIAGVTDDQLAKTILGKLVSLSILESAGVDFGRPINTLVRDVNPDERDTYMRLLFSSMPNLLVDENQVHLDLFNNSASDLLAEILQTLERQKIYLKALSDKYWRRRVLKIIKKILVKRRTLQASYTKDHYDEQTRVRRLVDELDLDTLSPLLDVWYKQCFIERYCLLPQYYRSPESSEYIRQSLIARNQCPNITVRTGRVYARITLDPISGIGASSPEDEGYELADRTTYNVYLRPAPTRLRVRVTKENTDIIPLALTYAESAAFYVGTFAFFAALYYCEWKYIPLLLEKTSLNQRIDAAAYAVARRLADWIANQYYARYATEIL